MRVEKAALIIVVVCATIVLAVPFWRGLAGSQFRQAAPWAEKSIWTDNINAAIPSPHPKTDAQLLKERPDDFQLRLALAQRAVDREEHRRASQAVAGLLRDYPGEGIAYVLAMGTRAYESVGIPRRIEGWGITDEESRRGWKEPEAPTQEELAALRRCIGLLDKAITADPGNGFFHLQKACYLYGLHSDTEALQEIHVAATSPRFTDYTGVRTKALDHWLDLRGDFDPDRRVGVRAAMLFPAFARMREAARITSHLAYDQIRSGNTERGVRMALDVANAGHRMARDGETLIQGLVGAAILHIGAATLDPTFKPQTDDVDADRAARLARYRQFLLRHGYRAEAANLEKQWWQTSRMIHGARQFARTVSEVSLQALAGFHRMFSNATGILAILLVLAVGWAVAALLTAKGGGRGLWDRRAAATSLLVSALVLAPVVTVLVKAHGSEYAIIDALEGTTKALPSPWLLFIPIGIVVFALAAGWAVMMARDPEGEKERRMPVSALLVAYLALAGGLVYLAYGLQSWSESGGFLAWLYGNSAALMILGPLAGIALYGIVRAVQARFASERRSAPLTLVATIRYGSAGAVALFAVVYIVLLMMTAHYGTQADSVARNWGKAEVALIRDAFR